MSISTYTKKILFIGGDLRQIHAINKLADKGSFVSVLGFDGEEKNLFSKKIQILTDFSEAETSYDAIVLPLPYSTDGKNINTPFFKGTISVSEVFENFSTKNRIFAGRCDPKIKAMAESHRIMLVDYLCREELAVRNAIPTAEGAIQIAMSETPFTVHSSRCLVIGNGRIGKILSKMLFGIGGKVTVAARKKGDLAYASAMGYDTVSVYSLDDVIDTFDIIFNTAPSLILDFDLLAKVKKNVLIIDLASKPGGVDFDEARRLGIKVIWALSLPGKVAAETAGDIICSTILNILDEMEVKQ
ncbi:MAG: dipicolinate synthase subunit DpsA [Clostridia bacterium]|nr:dipicolinate synthase subunit DpsA [Clostridia bacterium]